MKRSFVLVVLVSALILANCERSKNKEHLKETSKRRFETLGDAKVIGAVSATAGAPAAGGAVQPAIKLDRTSLLIPNTPMTMMQKPQIIIERQGLPLKSEVGNDQRRANIPCELQQGYVLLQKSLSESGPTPVLIARPALAVVNKFTISFFDSESVHTLLKSYILRDITILTNNQLWAQSNCLPIIYVSGKNDPREPGSKPDTVFCTESKQDFDQWVNAIDTFHRCTVKVPDSPEDGGSDKIKSKVSRKDMQSDADLEADRKKAVLNVEDAYTNTLSEQEKEEKRKMDELTKKIMVEYKKHKELEKKKRLELQDERKRMADKQRKLGSLAKCVEDAVQMKSMQDEANLEQLLGEERSMKEGNLIKDAYAKMKRMWQKETEDLNGQDFEMREASSKIYEKMKAELISETGDFVKNLDPSDCYKDTLSGGNIREMKKACANTVEYGAVPDLKKLLSCLEKKTFCPICCKYYIGPANEKDELTCQKRCEEIINSDSNAWTVTYGINAQVTNAQTG